VSAPLPTPQACPERGRRPSRMDSSNRPSASLGMTHRNVIPTEGAKRPPPCHPDRGSEATPALSSRPRERCDRAEGPVGHGVSAPLPTPQACPERGRRPSRMDSSNRPLASLGMTLLGVLPLSERSDPHSVIPTEGTKRPPHYHPDQGSGLSRRSPSGEAGSGRVE